MKATASIQTAMFFNPTAPLTGPWGTTSQRSRRRPAGMFRLPGLSTDDLAATKQEIVCGGVLGLCFLYTFVSCFVQLAS